MAWWGKGYYSVFSTGAAWNKESIYILSVHWHENLAGNSELNWVVMKVEGKSILYANRPVLLPFTIFGGIETRVLNDRGFLFFVCYPLEEST